MVTERRCSPSLQVHRLRSVDNLFVVVQEFKDYQFKETKVSFAVSQLWGLECHFNCSALSVSRARIFKTSVVLSLFYMGF